MMNYGNEQAADNNEHFVDIPQNRTLMLESLTSEPPLRPEVVHGLQTTNQVFHHYKPSVEMDFRDINGALRVETLQFTSLDDFGADSIVAQSQFLKSNQQQKDRYLNIIRQLRTNKTLSAALNDTSARQALLDAVHSMITELKQANN